jgi:prepilin-type N-terminal cleavage/methylation domain-containing protein
MQVKPMSVKQKGFTIIELVVVILLLGILAATALPRFINVTTQAHDSAFQATAGGLVTGAALYRAEWTARGQASPNVPLQSYGGLRSAPGYSNGSYTAGPPSSFTTPSSFTGSSTGYPLATVNSINKGSLTTEHCVQVFENVLQTGAPTVVRAREGASPGTAITTAINLGTVVENTLNTTISTSAGLLTADFHAFPVTVEINTGFARTGTELTSQSTGDPSNYVDNVPGCMFAYTAEAENFSRTILYVPWNGRLEYYSTLADLLADADYDGPVVQ